MIPTECKMQALYPDLEKLIPSLMLTVAFIGDGTLSQNAALVRRNLVRLVDKAISEYMLARNNLLLQIAESQRPAEQLLSGRFLYMFDFINHMENCINAIRRAIGLLEYLRSDRSAPTQDKVQRGIVNADVQSLIDIRNTLEHMGDCINNFNGHKPVMLRLRDDQSSLEIGNFSLSFDSIAKILNTIHQEANNLLEKPHINPNDIPFE